MALEVREQAAARPGSGSGIDPVTFEVLKNVFDYATGRMSTVLQRSSFSPILAELVDYSNAVYDADMNCLSQAANCPVHLAAMKYSAWATAERFGIDNLEPGDVVALNDPYNGGTHINDITFTTPIHFEGERLGFAVSRGHWMDLGGGSAGGQNFYGTHIAGEGLRIPPLKIYRRGELNTDLLEILIHNTRTPQYIEGDLQAHMGALRVAEAELTQAAERYGAETVRAAMREVIAYTERIVRTSIEKIPDGVYHAEDYADTDGYSDEPIRVKVKLVIEGSDITVDFDGSSPQCKGAINSTLANTTSAALYSLQFFLAPHAPANEGMFEPIKVILPEDCWLNAKWPAPTIGSTTLASSKITSALWQALAKALPDQVSASTYADCNWFVAAVTAPDGSTNVISDLPAGGWGGTPYNDGMHVTQDPLGNCMNLQAEAAELFYPVTYEQFDLKQDSAGAGRYRGGLGANFKARFLCEGELSMETARTIEGTPGANGGGRSAVQRSIKEHADGAREVLGGWTPEGEWKNPLLTGQFFRYGESFVFESTGGGGWGDPFTRPVGEVLDDVLDEYISVRAAREQYGVAIDPETFEVDRAETARLRSRAA